MPLDGKKGPAFAYNSKRSGIYSWRFNCSCEKAIISSVDLVAKEWVSREGNKYRMIAKIPMEIIPLWSFVKENFRRFESFSVYTNSSPVFAGLTISIGIFAIIIGHLVLISHSGPQVCFIDSEF